jgi:hypothetical protein
MLLVSIISISALSNAVLAQPSEETMEKARKLGLLNMKKGEMPAYLKVPNLHLTQSVPSNFPVDAYRSNVVSSTFMNSTSGAPSASLSIITKDSPATVDGFYQSSLRSHNFALSIPKAEMLAKLGPPGSAFMMQGTRSKERVSVNIVGRKDGNTYIAVTWTITN